MGTCPNPDCAHAHPPVTFAAWAWAVRDTKPHPPAQQLAVLFMLASRLDPVTGCGWTTREQLTADTGVGKTTAGAALAWAAEHFLLRKLERGHYRGDGTTTGTWWALTGTTACTSMSAPGDIEDDGSTTAEEDIEPSTTALEDIEDRSKSGPGDIEDGSKSAQGAVENGSLSPRGGTLSRTTGSVREQDLAKEYPSGIPSSAPGGADPGDDPGESEDGEDPPGLDAAGARADVEALCEYMAGSVERLTGKRPRVTKRWRQAARRLLDLDHRTEEQVRAAIDWCHADEFWAYNVLSMPKLRDKYVQLQGAAMRKPGNGRAPGAGVGQVLQAMNENAAAREHGGYAPRLELTEGAS